MHPQAELDGGSQRMFLIIMFQLSAVAEVIAQRRFYVCEVKAYSAPIAPLTDHCQGFLPE